MADALAAGGAPLAPEALRFWETGFGHDLSGVRLHDDHRAARANDRLDADAFALGSHIAFAAGRYRPETSVGHRLIAHELAHVVQQRSGETPIVRRQRRGARQAASGTHGRVLFVQVERSTDTITFVTEQGSLAYHLLAPTSLGPGTYSFAVAVHGHNLSLTGSAEQSTFSGFQYSIAAGQDNPADLLRGQSDVSVQVLEGGDIVPHHDDGALGDDLPPGSVSVAVIFEAVPLDDPSAGSSAGLPSFGAGPAIGLGLHNYAFNDLSWLNSPFSEAYWGPLIPRSGILLDRSVVGLGDAASALPRDLTPRLDSYRARQSPGDPLSYFSDRGDPIPFRPDPLSSAERSFSAEEMLSIESLVRRYRASPGSLSGTELQLLREAARIHISGSTPAAPFASYSTPGNLVPWTNQRRFVVRVRVDPGAAIDVSQANAFNGGAEAITNVSEAEFLVVADQSGRIVSVQQAEAALAGETSFALRHAEAIRWGGRVVLVAGLAYSAYRIGSASPEERPRVVGEEGGGLLGGLGGSAAATAGCIAFGIATEGVGLFICGLAGGIGGGVLGSHAGGAFMGGGWVDDFVREGARRDFEHFQQINPGATPADYDRMQQVQDDFDTWGIP